MFCTVQTLTITELTRVDLAVCVDVLTLMSLTCLLSWLCIECKQSCRLLIVTDKAVILIGKVKKVTFVIADGGVVNSSSL